MLSIIFAKKYISMKYLIYVLMAIATALMVFNITKLDFQYLFEGQNMVPLIGVLAPLVVIVLLAILLISKKIEDKVNS